MNKRNIILYVNRKIELQSVKYSFGISQIYQIL